MQDRDVLSVKMNDGVEEEVCGLLSQPTTNILLLMDIQFSSQKWKDMLLWRITQALKSSKKKPNQPSQYYEKAV